MSENVVATSGDKYVVVEVEREDRATVAGVLLDLVGEAKGDLRTVTNVRHGFGFRLPVKYADAVHASLFGPFEDNEDDTNEGEEVVAEQDDDPEFVEEVEEIEVPDRNDKRDDWAEFLTAKGVPFEEDAKRGDLIALWDSLKK